MNLVLLHIDQTSTYITQISQIVLHPKLVLAKRHIDELHPQPINHHATHQDPRLTHPPLARRILQLISALMDD